MILWPLTGDLLTNLCVASLGSQAGDMSWYWSLIQTTAPDKFSKEDWMSLSSRQRKRRRERLYWDRVLAHTARQLAKKRVKAVAELERADWGWMEYYQKQWMHESPTVGEPKPKCRLSCKKMVPRSVIKCFKNNC